MDKWTPAATIGAAKSMRSNRSKGTRPEQIVQLALVGSGIQCLFNDRLLPGKPDVALHDQKVAVFVHGCYWHSCPRCHPDGRSAHGPNEHLWLTKFAANVERFERQREALLDAGWLPLVIWECELRAKGPRWAVAFVQAAAEQWTEIQAWAR